MATINFCKKRVLSCSKVTDVMSPILGTDIALDIRESGHGEEMQCQDLLFEAEDIASWLHWCTNAKNLSQGNLVYELLVEISFDQNELLQSLLVQMYGKCGALHDALAIFNRLVDKETPIWNVIIRTCMQQHKPQQAVAHFKQMQQEGTTPDKATFVSVLSACASQATLLQAKQMHTSMLGNVVESETFTGTALVNLYGKCGSLKDAFDVFHKMLDRDVVTWNSMISLCAKHGCQKEASQLFKQMQLEGVWPSDGTFISILDAYARQSMLAEGSHLHVHIAESQFRSDLHISNALLNMYCKCGSIEDGQKVFVRMPKRDVITWTSMIIAYSQKEHDKTALQLFYQMQQQGVRADEVTLSSVLIACAAQENLVKGQQVHFLVVEYGLEVDTVLATSLMNMYGKCGTLENAYNVFLKLRLSDVTAWNAVINLYHKYGHDQEALKLFNKMQHQGIPPDNFTFVGLLSACGSSAGLQEGKLAHAFIVEQTCELDSIIITALVTMYGKCGSLDDSRSTFNFLVNQDVASWNAIVAACTQQGQNNEAVQFFDQMVQEAVFPDRITFISVLEACAVRASLVDARKMHTYITNCNLELDTVLGNALLYMYGNLGRINDALKIFRGMPDRDIISWNSMIATYSNYNLYSQALQLVHEMHQGGEMADTITFVLALSACAQLRYISEGKQMHTCIISNMCQLDTVLATSLINMYGNCGRISDAVQVFNEMTMRDIVSWNAMIKMFAQAGMRKELLHIFVQMEKEGLQPDKISFLNTFEAYAGREALSDAQLIHFFIVDRGCEEDFSIGNALISMYGRCGSVMTAQMMFDKMSKKDAVSWNAMIAVYTRSGQLDEALCLFDQMQRQTDLPNAVTLTIILSACASKAALAQGRQIHACIVGQGWESDVVLRTALLSMYEKCGSVEDAQKIFMELPEQNVILWTSMITAHAQHGQGVEAIQLYYRMQQEGLVPDNVALLNILAACSHTGLIGEALDHFTSTFCSLGLCPTANHYVCVIDLLGRAGRLDEAEFLMTNTPFPPTSELCTALLGACKSHTDLERGQNAAKLVLELEKGTTAPYITLSNIYAACDIRQTEQFQVSAEAMSS